MRIRFILYFLVLAFVLSPDAQGQRWKLKRYEASVGLGTTHAFMDIAPPADGLRSFQFQGTRPNVSLDAVFRIFEPLSANLSLTYIMFGGVDSENRMTVHSFITNAFEPTLNVEYSFLQGGKAFGTNALFNRRGMVNDYGTADIYVFAGVGGLLTKAIAFDENLQVVTDDIYFDNNMHFGLVFPVGLGFKYAIDSWWSVGVEVGGRFTMTDLIDGYATPFSEYNDRYILTNVKAIYKIRSDRRGLPVFRRYGFAR
jgi:hypothetical protein